MRFGRSPLAIALGGLVVALAAAGIGAAATRAGGGSAAPTVTTLPAPPPDVEIAARPDGAVRWDQALRVAAVHGTIQQVVVTDDVGQLVSGVVTADGAAWESATTLVPAATYTVSAVVADARHRPTGRTKVVHTADADRHLVATISPGDGNVVGVGMPVAVTFNRAVPSAARAEVVRRLAISTTPALNGAWHWMSSTEVHWRPPDYWPAGAQVVVHTDLTRLDVGGGVWGGGVHTSTFRVGDSHVSVADAASHTMTVSSNGKVLRVLPMSAGRDQYPTRGGVHIALEKSQVVTMDSQTVGIPRDSPDGYYEKVYWDVRISNGGAFVHAAPWSVAAQGQRNVSHGCINLSPDDAQWFYGFSLRGDIVNVVHAGGAPDLADPGMADWNLPWSAWAGTGA